jgi:peptide/nickel transport system substrate-binding protein
MSHWKLPRVFRGRGPNAAVGLGVALTLLATAACGSDAGEGASAGGWAEGPVTFVYASAIAPAHIDPALASDLNSYSVTRNLYDPLVWEDASFEPVPWLATEWATSEDGLTTTFTLREDVQFEDGSTLTAADVKLSIERVLALGQGPASLLTAIQSVEALDEQRVAITTATPDPYLLTHLTRVGIVSAAGVDEHKTTEDPWATEWFDKNSNGTGPYQLGDWQQGVQLTMDKNTDWWQDWKPGSIDVVINKFVTETSARIQMVEQGTADFTELWPATDAVRVGERDGFSVQRFDSYEIDPMFYLNTQKAPFDNPLVRQAAQLAFDYQAMNDYYQGNATTPSGPIPTDYLGIEDAPAYERDLDRAKELIEESGVDVAATPVRFMLPAGVDSFSVGATVFQESLEEAGFDVEIQQMPFAQVMEAFSSVETAGEASAIISSPYTSDPTLFLGNFYLPGAVFNFSLYDNPEVTGLIEQARTTLDETERTGLLTQAQEIIRDDAPAIWAARPQTLVAMPDHVTGYEMPLTDYRWSMYFWPLQIKAH